MEIKLLMFLIISLVTVGFALVVAVSKNIVYSAFALLGVFAGVLGLYILLSADFIAIIQLVIYIGGILILILFAVMLTSKIGERKLSNRTMSPVTAIPLVVALGGIVAYALSKASFAGAGEAGFSSTAALIGNKLLGEYLLPFEIVSLLLILVLVGAVVIGRREVK